MGESRWLSQGAWGCQCHTVKVVERENHIKVHSKDLSQLVHQCRVINGENGHVVSRLVSETTEHDYTLTCVHTASGSIVMVPVCLVYVVTLSACAVTEVELHIVTEPHRIETPQLPIWFPLPCMPRHMYPHTPTLTLLIPLTKHTLALVFYSCTINYFL